MQLEPQISADLLANMPAFLSAGVCCVAGGSVDRRGAVQAGRQPAHAHVSV